MPLSVYDFETMRALYPKPITLPSFLLLAVLAGCEQAVPELPAPVNRDDWSHEHEALFQEAEALKYSLEQHRLEEQKLRDAGLPVTPPAPLQ
jgi:hypothetical protein